MKKNIFLVPSYVVLFTMFIAIGCKKEPNGNLSFDPPTLETLNEDTILITDSIPIDTLTSDSVPQIDTNGLASFILTITPNEDNPLTFEVHNHFAVLSGYINSTTPTQIQFLIDQYPAVTTIVMMEMPGSDDDEANLIAARKIRAAGYCTYVPEGTFLASGAVDMFFAGVERDLGNTSEMGVHSWSDGSNDATDFSQDDPQHQFYIDYYIEMGLTDQMASDFYFFTINAAPANDIHWMTQIEIDQYGLRTN